MTVRKEQPPAGYVEGQRLTTEYIHHLERLFREDVAAHIAAGALDGVVQEELRRAIRSGALDTVLKDRLHELSRQSAKPKKVSPTVRDSHDHSKPYRIPWPMSHLLKLASLFAIGVALFLAGRVYMRETPAADDQSPPQQTRAVVEPHDSGAPETSDELIRRVEDLFDAGPDAFGALVGDLRSGGVSTLRDEIDKWLAGENVDTDRIRRGMAQLIVRERNPSVGIVVDGHYTAPCGPRSCEALLREWRADDADPRVVMVPPYPINPGAWNAGTAKNEMAKYELFLIASRLGLIRP